LQKKHETLQVYKDFEAKIRTQFNRPIKILHSDYGGEYKEKEFILHLKKAGTLEKLTVHNMPQHNGIAERFNCTVVEKVCAMLHTSGLPWTLWGEAAHHAVWVINCTTTKALDGMTPFEAATGKKPDLCHVREWGEKVWVRLEKGTKLGDCMKEGHWIGVDDQSKGFRIYWPDTRKVSVEWNMYHGKDSASADCLKGEDWDLLNDDPAEQTLANDILSRQTSAPDPVPHNNDPDPNPVPEPPPRRTCRPAVLPDLDLELELPAKRICKPSQQILNIVEGKGTSSAKPADPLIPTGVRLPSPIPENEELEGEGESDWMMALDDDFFEEYALAAEMSKAEALKPCTLTEAQ
jgi:hypothetical protein